VFLVVHGLDLFAPKDPHLEEPTMAVSERDMDVGGITISLFGMDELKNRAQQPAKVVAVIVAHGR
jgi:hypothetical protein